MLPEMLRGVAWLRLIAVQRGGQPVHKRADQINRNIDAEEIVDRKKAVQQFADRQFPRENCREKRRKEPEEHKLNIEPDRLLPVDLHAPGRTVAGDHQEHIDRPCPQALVHGERERVCLTGDAHVIVMQSNDAAGRRDPQQFKIGVSLSPQALLLHRSPLLIDAVRQPSLSGLMSILQPVSFAARRAF